VPAILMLDRTTRAAATVADVIGTTPESITRTTPRSSSSHASPSTTRDTRRSLIELPSFNWPIHWRALLIWLCGGGVQEVGEGETAWGGWPPALIHHRGHKAVQGRSVGEVLGAPGLRSRSATPRSTNDSGNSDHPNYTICLAYSEISVCDFILI
jgi:hypothetical protein